MADLRSRIAALSPAQRALLESRVADLVAAQGSAPDRIKPRDRSRPAPLGIAQQREWAIARLRGANNIAGAFRVEGELDVSLLSLVLTEVVERHEVLRSTVEIGDGGVPVQTTRPVVPVRIGVADLTDLAAEQQLEQVRRIGRAEAVRPFDPDECPRLRVRLLRLAPDVHVAVLVTDHAASDAWSLGILTQEIAALYAMHRAGGPGLPRPGIQFADFAAWQREQVGEERIAAELAHWRRTLDGIPATMALPADRPSPSRPTYAASVHTVDLPAELAVDIRRFGDREHASLFPILLAASAVLLYRHVGQDDLLIGSLVTGRTRVETEGLVGCFANPLPLRMRVADHQTLRQVVAAARDTLATALDHQDVPFDRLISELGLGRESARTSLSRMWINVIALPARSLDLPGLRFGNAPIGLGLASVDLTLSAIPDGDGLRLQWQYMTELFDPDTVVLLAEQFQTVLEYVVRSPDRTVDEVEFAPVPGPAAAATDTAPGIVELIQRRVNLAPRAPAVVCDGVATSYADLNRQANRLAHRLRGQGVGPGTPVAIPMEASPALAVAILSVLKVGGCPLGPAAGNPHRTVLLEDVYAAGADVDAADPPPVQAPPEQAAQARDIADRLGLGAGDRVLPGLPMSGLPVDELLPTWLAGGTVVLPGETDTDLVTLVARERVSVVILSTARWQEWVRDLDRREWSERSLPACLRLVVVRGSPPTRDERDMWRRLGVPLQVAAD
jgi:hypothetical protein